VLVLELVLGLKLAGTRRLRAGALASLGVLVACSDPAGTPDAAPADAGMPVTYDFRERLADPNAPFRELGGLRRFTSTRENEPPEGRANHDWFTAPAGVETTIFDASGPGAVLRVWMTFRDLVAMTYLTAVEAVFVFAIDGVEIDFDGGERGTRLGDLLGAAVPAFEVPWSAGRDQSSGGFQILLPIEFQRSLRVTFIPPSDFQTYFQFDWVALPANAVVRSFDGMPWPADLAARVAALWEAPAERGTMQVEDSMRLDPGASLELAVPASVVRRIELESPALRSGSLRLVLDNSGAVADAPAHHALMVAVGGDYSSALSGALGDRAWLDYPFGVATSATLRVRNDGTAATDVRALVRYDPVDAEAPRLFWLCGEEASTMALANYVLADVSDGPGQLAGTYLRMRANLWGWVMLEGDHEIRTDGEWTVLGTGTEDYFGGAYYFLNGAYALPTVGASYVRYNGDPDAEVAMYRHHLIDPVPYERDLRVDFEAFEPFATASWCVLHYAR
jgi:hypothetical protein